MVCTVAASITAGVSTVFSISVNSSFSSCVLFNSISSGSWGILAATLCTLAASKAPYGNKLNSCQSALVTTMVPASSKLNSIGKMPTLTLSNTPSFASCSASLPSVVSLILASNMTVSPTNSRAVTKPIGLVLSWFRYILGFLPSSGSAPGSKRTFCPSDTTASTPYCRATPARVLRGSASPLAASKFKSCGINLSIVWYLCFVCYVGHICTVVVFVF